MQRDLKKLEAIVIGEALIDILPGDGPEPVEVPGGSAANTALALGRLDRHVRLLTALGEDGRGRRIRSWLSDAGVLIDRTVIGRTSTATASIDSEGSAQYSFDLEWRLDAHTLAPASLVHTGSIAAILEPGAERVLELVQGAHTQSTISVDPNVRPALIDETDRSKLTRLLRYADVIKLSDEDLAWLAPGQSASGAADQWISGGAAFVIVTRGAEGAIAYTRNFVTRIPAVPTRVVDTVGAGDTFMAATIDALIQHGLTGAENREALRDIPLEVTESVLEFAARAAAVTVSRQGANPPTKRQLRKQRNVRAGLKI